MCERVDLFLFSSKLIMISSSAIPKYCYKYPASGHLCWYSECAMFRTTFAILSGRFDGFFSKNIREIGIVCVFRIFLDLQVRLGSAHVGKCFVVTRMYASSGTIDLFGFSCRRWRGLQIRNLEKSRRRRVLGFCLSQCSANYFGV